jgi:hypothetical protein
MKHIRQVAKTLQVESGKLTKTELIRKIQAAEGNFDCYGSAVDGECDQLDCTWRNDCLSEPRPAAVELT